MRLCITRLIIEMLADNVHVKKTWVSGDDGRSVFELRDTTFLVSLANSSRRCRLSFPLRVTFNKRSVGSSHSSHGNLSQASITSCDVLGGDGVDIPQQHPPNIGEQRSNSSADIQGTEISSVFLLNGLGLSCFLFFLRKTK